MPSAGGAHKALERRGLPLASLDGPLRAALKKAGGSLLL